MRTNTLGQFFRVVGNALSHRPEVRSAVKQAGQKLEHRLEQQVRGRLHRFADRFEPAARAPRVPTAQQRASDAEYVRGLYHELLGREPDAEGFAAHMAGLAGNTTRAQLRQVFLDSPEYAALQRPPVEPSPSEPPAPAPAPTPAPRTYPEPGPALSTVPPKSEYLDVPVDQSSPQAAVLSTARWVREHRPQYFNQGDDRAVAFAMMTEVIGVLRAHGYDATRVVNHPDRPMGDGLRYGSDALVADGHIYDVFGSWGSPGGGTPQLLDAGPYAAGRLRE